MSWFIVLMFYKMVLLTLFIIYLSVLLCVSFVSFFLKQVPLYHKGVGPSLNLVVDNEHYFHHFATSITTSNASVSIGMDQICRDQSISEDKCMNMAKETELFVDQYLVNETKVAVKRVMQNMFVMEGTERGDGGQVRDFQAEQL
jgi:hypothetical protein|tara:strand:+ start:1317 stop:1748 length:432 start_codon:yes stop_codon:yes gene_type:complete